MSTLADRLAQPQHRPHNGPKCSIGILLNTLDVADREALTGALRLDSGKEHQEISEDLEAENIFRPDGRPFKGHSIGWHRNGRCAC